MRLRRDIKAYVEAELRDYDDTLRAIGEERNELILASPIHDNNGGKSYDIGNPTESKTLKLLTNKRIRQMETTCKAIATVIDELPDYKLQAIELKYWKRPRIYTDQGISQEIGCNRVTLYRWIDGILFDIAVEMGLASK